MKLPKSFHHKPPKGYSYEVQEFKRGVLSIWIRHHRKFDYNNGETVSCIWGFYSLKKDEYYAPINATKVGKKVNISDTRNYTSMPLKLSPLELCFQ